MRSMIPAIRSHQNAAFMLAAILAVGSVALLPSFSQAKDAWLGVAISHTTTVEMDDTDRSESNELMVSRVVENSPAAAAGLQEGDILLAIGGKTITDTDDFIKAVSGRDPGDELTIRVRRGDEEMNLTAELGLHEGQLAGMGDRKHKKMVEIVMDGDGDEHTMEWIGEGDNVFKLKGMKGLDDMDGFNVFMSDSDMNFGQPRLGVHAEAIDEALARATGRDKGLLVLEIVEGSAAEKAGLERGDILTKANGEDLREVDGLRMAINSVSKDENESATLKLETYRGRNKRIVDVAQAELGSSNGVFTFEMDGDAPIGEHFLRRMKGPGAPHAPRMLMRRHALNDEARSELHESLQEMREELKNLRSELEELRGN